MKKCIYCFLLILAACGGCGGSSTSSPPANRAPQAANQSVATNPGEALSGSLSATDADGDALTYTVVTGSASGSVTLSGTGNRSFEYTPNGGFTGEDSFTFTASDGDTTSNTATVTVTVNNRPIAVAGSFSTSDAADHSGVVSSTDVEGDNVVYEVTAEPRKGTITAFDSATGAFTYTAIVGEDGLDSFSFAASDPYQSSSEAVINIEIFGWIGTQQFGGTSDEISTTGGMILGDDGSLIFGGGTEGSIAGAINQGGRDAWLRKVDRRGNELWTIQFGTAQDDAVRNLWRNPLGDGFFAVVSQDWATTYRFDDSGNELWSTLVDFTGLDIEAPAYWANFDDKGNIYLLSWYRTSISTLGSVLTKLDGTDGSVVWHRELDPSDSNPGNPFVPDSQIVFARGIAFDSSGQLVVSGSFEVNGSSTRTCIRCPFLASFDESGSTLWVREPGSFSSCGRDGSGQFFRTTVDDDDSLLVVGISERSSSASGDGLVARFSADGTQELWSYCDDSGDVNSFLFSPALKAANGHILVYGSLEAAPDPMSGLRESSDLVAFRLDENGTLLWDRVIEGNRSDGSAAILFAGTLVEDSQGVLYLNGWSDGEHTNAANAGGTDIILMRLDADGMPR
ncbi:MAG: cadherin-like domain-containing protein [Gammaproteobacteria bacterium]|nr:cadherin-like domain-containing protein [Gammaproteobacteria bacterium]